VFAVLGNHDWVNDGTAISRALSAAGITVLENAAVPIVVRGTRLWIAGFADITERRPDVPATLAPIPGGEPILALSHDPDLFTHLPSRIALTLAGHTHAGQVAIPVLRRYVIPSRHGERYAVGHVVENGRHLVVTAGVGTSRWPVRLLAPPEALVLRLEPRRGRHTG
jgi:predicted MPP superfamily phosphohydrolase